MYIVNKRKEKEMTDDEKWLVEKAEGSVISTQVPPERNLPFSCKCERARFRYILLTTKGWACVSCGALLVLSPEAWKEIRKYLPCPRVERRPTTHPDASLRYLG